MREKFVEFLKEKGCYEEWVKNLMETPTECFTEDEFFDFIPDQPWRFMGAGFVWNLSDQGHEFWSDISDEWEIRRGC